MGKIVLFTLLALGALAALAMFMRRRSGPGFDYEVHPPYGGTATNGDYQEPDYYGGEVLGRTEGYEHYPARSSGY